MPIKQSIPNSCDIAAEAIVLGNHEGVSRAIYGNENPALFVLDVVQAYGILIGDSAKAYRTVQKLLRKYPSRR